MKVQGARQRGGSGPQLRGRGAALPIVQHAAGWANGLDLLCSTPQGRHEEKKGIIIVRGGIDRRHLLQQRMRRSKRHAPSVLQKSSRVRETSPADLSARLSAPGGARQDAVRRAVMADLGTPKNLYSSLWRGSSNQLLAPFPCEWTLLRRRDLPTSSDCPWPPSTPSVEPATHGTPRLPHN